MILGQAAPADTSNAVLYTVTGVRVILHKLIVCNTTGTDAECRVFMSDNNAAATASEAILYDKVVPLKDAVEIDFDETKLTTPAGTITIRSGTNDALTFTLFGEEEEMT